MIRWVALLLLLMTGCEIERTPVALPAPPRDMPTCNLPLPLRQSNWLGGKKKDEGSCVYASLTSHARWLNLPELATHIRKTYGGGEYETRLISNLDSMGLKHSYTRKADVKFLDWCDAERRGAILWWKPSHCCTFMGWVDRGGKRYAVILDNNRTEDFELVEREQFVRLWAGYGGFALCLMYDPATSIPYPSYELR